jgi:RNA polymerase sigma factor (sigma-70 family)
MKDELILQNKGLIIKVMNDLKCKITCEDDFEDYYYAGLFGLIQATKQYDDSKGKSTYLYKGIKMAIQREFRRRVAARRNGKKPLSLNKYITDGIEFEELITNNSEFENELITKIWIRDALNKLPNRRYKEVLIQYYGIDCLPVSTPKIALKYGTTQQNINELRERGLKRLKKELLR